MAPGNVTSSASRNWIYAFAYLALMLATLSAVYLQFSKNRDLALSLLHQQSLQAVEQINFVVKTATDQINVMRIMAEEYFLLNPPTEDVPKHLVNTILKPSKSFSGFALDTPPEGWDKNVVGNLNGNGRIEELGDAHVRELNMAFSLNASFKAAADAIPNLAWIYYTSKRQFQNVAPWIPTSQAHYTDELHTLEFYTLGLPETNTGRSPFWTSAYTDTYGKGLMVTGGAPVYDGDTFVGTVALDLTLEQLSAFLDANQLASGTSFIINTNDQIIAHPTLIKSTEPRDYVLSDVLPGALEPHADRLLTLDSDEFVSLDGGMWALRHPVENTPWSYIAYVSDTEVSRKIVGSMVSEFLVAGLFVFSLFGFERVRRANLRVERAREAKEALSVHLSKYLSPQIYQSIFSGEQAVEVSTKRKKLTIFFSDIKDFTATTEDMEPEDMTYLLNDYLTKMTEIALEYGGTIDKYIGDAIVIFFGDPESKGVKQDAMAAVRMAVAMQRRMVDMRAKWSDMGFRLPFHIRCGINTGYCNVGNFGSEQRIDYTIFGGQVNLAARLESICSPDGITVSFETFSFVRDEFDAEPLDPIQVKGIQEPVKPFSISGIFNDRDDNERYIRRDIQGMRIWIDLMRMTEDQREKTITELEGALKTVREKSASDPEA